MRTCHNLPSSSSSSPFPFPLPLPSSLFPFPRPLPSSSSLVPRPSSSTLFFFLSVQRFRDPFFLPSVTIVLPFSPVLILFTMASSTSGTDLYKRRLINSEPDNSQIPRRDMTSCEICKIRVTKGNLSRHTKTQTHQRALSRVSFDNQYVVDFLNESTKSKANQRNGCLSSFLDAITSGRLTSLIDQKDCWGVGKTPMVFPSDLGCNLADLHEDVMRNSAKGATVYEVGRSYSPKTNKMAALWESYFSPASERCFYAVDVLVSSLRLEIPHELAAKQNNYNRHGLITTANVTPTGTFVDLHIGIYLQI